MKSNKKINLLFLSWRDIKSSKMGGAEIFTHEMIKRLDSSKFQVTHFSPKESNLESEEVIDGVKYLRKGNVISVMVYAFLYYFKNNKTIDFVVDQCNEHRFFTPFWVNRKKRIFFIHHIGKKQWLRNLRFPFGHIGYYSEDWMTRLYRKNRTFTVSKSTKDELLALGFKDDLVDILPEGINFEPWTKKAFLEKDKVRAFTYVGRFVKHKGIDIAIEAFGLLKQDIKDVKLWIVGRENEEFKAKILNPVCKKYGLIIGQDIIYHGFVSEEKKLELMSRSHSIVFPSEREGWGLPVTESAVVGTPSIVFNSPGLRDAVDYGNAGFMTHSNSALELKKLMAESIDNKEKYEEIRTNAYEFSKKLHWSKTSQTFETYIDKMRGVK